MMVLGQGIADFREASEFAVALMNRLHMMLNELQAGETGLELSIGGFTFRVKLVKP